MARLLALFFYGIFVTIPVFGFKHLEHTSLAHLKRYTQAAVNFDASSDQAVLAAQTSDTPPLSDPTCGCPFCCEL